MADKSIKFITRLLKNAESNADAKSIDVEDLIIKSIVVQQAPVRFSPIVLCNTIVLNNSLCCRKPAVAHTVPMVVSTPTRVTLATSKSSSLQLMWKSSEARTKMLSHHLSLA